MGSNDGPLEGALVRVMLGAAEGDIEGSNDGTMDGPILGFLVGAIVGSAEGSNDGTMDGPQLGLNVGASVGENVGSNDGPLEGALVGVMVPIVLGEQTTCTTSFLTKFTQGSPPKVAGLCRMLHVCFPIHWLLTYDTLLAAWQLDVAKEPHVPVGVP